MTKLRIFILEDEPGRIRYFREKFIDHDVTIVTSCAGVERFTPPYDLVFLDHDLGGRQLADHEDCGATFVRMLLERGLLPAYRRTFVVIHSYNPEGAKRMHDDLFRAGQMPVVMAPFRGLEFDSIVDNFLTQAKNDFQPEKEKEGTLR